MATWAVLSGASVSAASTQNTTDSAPSGSADGVALVDVDAIIPVLTAPNGQTFTGAGTLLGYWYSDKLARWVRAYRADDSFADLAGASEGVLPPLPVNNPSGRFAYICSGVGLSGGTTVTVTLLCSSLKKGGPL